MQVLCFHHVLLEHYNDQCTISTRPEKTLIGPRPGQLGGKSPQSRASPSLRNKHLISPYTIGSSNSVRQRCGDYLNKGILLGL